MRAAVSSPVGCVSAASQPDRIGARRNAPRDDRGVLRGVLVTAGVVVAVLAVVTGLLWGFQRSLIYLPQGSPAGTPAGAEDVVLHTGDGLDLAAWWFDAGADAPAVLVANGNGGHRGLREPLARALVDAGLSVLLFDYRGYAGNPGSPTEEGLAADVRAARSFLVEEAGVPPERLVYFGESLGAAVVTELAIEHPPAGLVLRSPFQDLAAVAGEHYPFVPARLLLRDRFPRGRAGRADRRPDDRAQRRPAPPSTPHGEATCQQAAVEELVAAADGQSSSGSG